MSKALEDAALRHNGPEGIEVWLAEHSLVTPALAGVPAPKTQAGIKHDTGKPADHKPTNPKDRAAVSRLDLSLFPDTARAYGALSMTEGDCKYGGYNYRVGGVLASVYVAAVGRHLMKWWNGEWADPITKVPHLASALAGIAVLIDGYESGVLVDDRPPARADVSRLLGEFEAVVKHLHEVFPDGPPRYTESGV